MKSKNTQHPFVTELTQNLKDSPQFIQVILGPRQVGKTTGVQQYLENYTGDFHEVSADNADAPLWLEQQWQLGQDSGSNGLLVIDEIQKISNWSEKIKALWDKQIKQKKSMRLIVLGSSSLEIQKGMSESLTGRFQIVKVPHWDFQLSKKHFGISFDEYFEFGGYPGSYALIDKPKVWRSYLQESIVETVIGKDILSLAQVRNPALFRQCFQMLTSLPAQTISYTKLLGQLHDKGNTDLIKHYIELFEGAFLLRTIPKFSKTVLRKKSSSPKIVPLCPALIHRNLFSNPEDRGRFFEAVVGAQLLNSGLEVTYWADGSSEVDFVVEMGRQIFAIEVKSGRTRSSKGLIEFLKLYPKALPVFISKENFEVFSRDPAKYLLSNA